MYINFIFDTLSSMISSIAAGAEAVGSALVGYIDSTNVLWILFAIQFSIIVVKFVLDTDGFAFVTSFIQKAVIYAIIQVVIANWTTYGFGFINFVNSLMTGAVASAAGSLSGGGATISASTNPADVLASMKTGFDAQFAQIEQQYEAYRKQMEENRSKGSSGAGSNPGEGSIPIMP